MSHTSLHINKGQTRFAPKVKPRGARRPNPAETRTNNEPASQPPITAPGTPLSTPADSQADGPPPDPYLTPASPVTRPVINPTVAATSPVRGNLISTPGQTQATPVATGNLISVPTVRATAASLPTQVAANPTTTTVAASDRRSSKTKPKTSGIAVAKAPTGRGRRQLKTWEEYLEEHAKLNETDLSDQPMDFFCRNRGLGLPMKSTIDRLWEEEHRKAAAADPASNSVAPKAAPAPPPSTKPETEAPATFTNNPHAAQVRMVNGRMVLNEESLVIDRSQMGANAEIIAGLQVVDEYQGDRPINSYTYARRKITRSAKWTVEETAQFFGLLSRYGTDFNMIAAALTDRNRTDVLRKFRREESQRPWIVTRALLNRPLPDSELAGHRFDMATAGAEKTETTGDAAGENDTAVSKQEHVPESTPGPEPLPAALVNGD
ncbi:hypothetical protein IWQ60_009448 [Tieghemiomyces parasiticus]|uniref:Myb-like domain-containing protein n=1 Tax=Tieghemiomyces parasiticus TaxID=78921 RepID=A0A9W7ZTZ7_9FUNG|nr:hypothetical protein IWQ60_009448 [Tieghemiomyces parasiticus]